MPKLKDKNTMATTIIENIKGRELPRQWAEKIMDNLDQTFTVIIRPQRRSKENLLWERNRIMDLLERNETNGESSEEWIERIKSARTTSDLKIPFE